MVIDARINGTYAPGMRQRFYSGFEEEGIDVSPLKP
jgi:hypothetical protein